MDNKNMERPYHIWGIPPALFSCLMITLIGISSVLGYVMGLSKVNNNLSTKIEVDVKTDSVLVEVIRSQTKVELEMLKVINENLNKVPTVNNIMHPQSTNNTSQVVNSFNRNMVCKDSIKH